MSMPKVMALVLAAALAGAAGAWIFFSGSEDTNPDPATAAVAASAPQGDGYIDARTKGSPDAPVTVYEVSDFQCPFCKMFVDSTFPTIEAEYIETGKVRLIFVNFPLVQLHPNAPAAHEFAMCAAKQNRFWQVHDLLFQTQKDWESLEDPADYFKQLGDSAALSSTDLDACFASGEVRSIVESEARTVWQSGINSTPSFMIEGGLLAGAHPIDTWRPILDSLVAAKQ